MSSLERQKAAAQVALATRYGSPRLDELRRDLRVEQLADHVRAVAGSKPPLTAGHVDRLTTLLQDTLANDSGDGR